jgi:hypothetical protein
MSHRHFPVAVRDLGGLDVCATTRARTTTTHRPEETVNVTDRTPALAEQAGWDDGSAWTEDEMTAWQPYPGLALLETADPATWPPGDFTCWLDAIAEAEHRDAQLTQLEPLPATEAESQPEYVGWAA